MWNNHWGVWEFPLVWDYFYARKGDLTQFWSFYTEISSKLTEILISPILCPINKVYVLVLCIYIIVLIYLVGQTCGEDLPLWHCAEDYNRPWSTWLCCPKNLTQWHVRHCCPKNLWSTWSCLLLLVSLQGCDRYLNDTDCLFSLDFLLASDLSWLENDHRWSHPILGFSQP